MTESESVYVLDADDTVTHVAGVLQETLGHFLGRSFWEASPGARELFEPYFGQARTTGSEVEFTALYAGYVARRRVVPNGAALTVHVTPVDSLDLRTLATLSGSLRTIEVELADRASEQPGPRAHASLQALP